MSAPGSSIEGSRWFAPLDGVRALAATVVLASHVQVTPVPTGTLAVWVFFGLSAFLLTGKFVSDSAAFSQRSETRAPQDSNLRPSGSKPDTLSS